MFAARAGRNFTWSGRRHGGQNDWLRVVEGFDHWTPRQAIPVMARASRRRSTAGRRRLFGMPSEASSSSSGRPRSPTNFARRWARAMINTITASIASRRRISKLTRRRSCFYEPGFNVIDATILPANGRFYLIVKMRRAIQPRSICASLPAMISPDRINLSAPFTRDWVGVSALRGANSRLLRRLPRPPLRSDALG